MALIHDSFPPASRGSSSWPSTGQEVVQSSRAQSADRKGIRRWWHLGLMMALVPLSPDPQVGEASNQDTDRRKALLRPSRGNLKIPQPLSLSTSQPSRSDPYMTLSSGKGKLPLISPSVKHAGRRSCCLPYPKHSPEHRDSRLFWPGPGNSASTVDDPAQHTESLGLCFCVSTL